MDKPTHVAPPLRRLEKLWKANHAALIAPTALVGLAYLFVLALYPLLRGYTSPADFIHIGQYYCQCNGYAPGSVGYDGQFYYYMAVDPLHASVHMDNAPFRYQRILFSLAVWALSLGVIPRLPPGGC